MSRVYGNSLSRACRRHHFGWAGRHYGRLERWLDADLHEVQAFVAAREEAYRASGRRHHVAGGRDVVRVHDRFATRLRARAAWRSASEICPSPRQKFSPLVLTALAITSRSSMSRRSPPGSGLRSPAGDSDDDAGANRRRRRSRRRPPSTVCGASSIATPQRHGRLHRPPLARLSDFASNYRMQRSRGARCPRVLRRRRLLDSRRVGSRKSLGAPARPSRSSRRRRPPGLLVTVRRGAAGVSYVVKRPLPDGSRPLFVVIRHTREEVTGRRVRRPRRLRRCS